ncbi:diaminopimelate decarboxylase [Alloalcanivorax xenomutans]|jgi:diaminopimelate decarboxylase|uniref:diaminopimelate decarboxylase n=1 Tax=Alloalcanivorax xenomutans TaxID=1094342 RepID=UPI0003B81474|nr:diaminopimelate decarboxylase [Alloalcanivorax xenomutans]ERS14251.1 diaminopimelate decarboxylase [Alcanivorax sp. PN-3]KYZ85372.1 diaminopimelate decarboxylase [Alcanivorax sp. KX64203]MBA4723552.1 diaminopimelate decarboxylase [Alcanivorax sp.]ARB47321.1 diaminopimelate decarboxylase [Alloalcanivorax xenomutans]MCE7525613.1 diaminopimelate decarboxylase [Alloalcanivorax xenomutans]|tara:strand:- start:54 stop:1295 length:1242 start_codon:yes stop_codon:yes gene_type:complete
MDHFPYRDGTLYVEELPLTLLAERFGTPLYVYSRAALETHYRAFDDAFGDHPHQVCYAVKANSNVAVLNVLARCGAGFDIVSGGELERVLRAGGDPDKIVFSGVGKTADEMARALQVGIHCFNVESAAELELLNLVAGELGQEAPIAIRVNPDVDAQTHPYISTGLKENKFGVDIRKAPALYQRAAELPHIRILGIDCHIGSQLTRLEPFEDALERVLALLTELQELGIEIHHLDLGGGLGVTYNDETPPAHEDYVAALLRHIPGELPVHIEPGRAIAANAGVFLTQVLFLKPTEHRNFAIVDGAMNDLIRPSLYSAWQDIVPVTPHEADCRDWDIVGPVCETGDFLGKDRALALEAGDLLAVRSAGAYGFAMASNYNSRGRPAEILVDGDQAFVVRQRETIEDQLKLETLLP